MQRAGAGIIEVIVLKPDGWRGEVVSSVGGFPGLGSKNVGVPFSERTFPRQGLEQEYQGNALGFA